MLDRRPEDERARAERKRLRVQLVVVAIGLALLPVAIAVRSRVLGGALIAVVFATAIYLRVSSARSARRRR